MTGASSNSATDTDCAAGLGDGCQWPACTRGGKACNATPNRVRLSVDELSIVFGALNAWNMDGKQRRTIKTKIAALSKRAAT